MNHCRRFAATAFLAALCFDLSLAQPEPPNESTPPPAPPVAPVPSPLTMPPAVMTTEIESRAADSLLVLVPFRAPADIRADLESAMNQRRAAEELEQRSKLLQARSESYVELQKHSIESIKVKLELAKTEKNDLEKQRLEAQKKRAEMELALLRQREALRSREIQAAKAQRELADVSVRVYDLQLSLAAKRFEAGGLGGQVMSGALAAQFDRLRIETRDLEKKVLEAEIEETSKRESVVKGQVEVAKQRMRVFEAQSKLSPVE